MDRRKFLEPTGILAGALLVPIPLVFAHSKSEDALYIVCDMDRDARGEKVCIRARVKAGNSKWVQMEDIVTVDNENKARLQVGNNRKLSYDIDDVECFELHSIRAAWSDDIYTGKYSKPKFKEYTFTRTEADRIKSGERVADVLADRL